MIVVEDLGLNCYQEHTTLESYLYLELLLPRT